MPLLFSVAVAAAACFEDLILFLFLIKKKMKFRENKLINYSEFEFFF